MTNVLPSPPFIDIPGVTNFRDAGGYPIASQPGTIVRRGLLFRSGEPSKLTEEGVSRLQQLGIARVYDLRSVQEFERFSKLGQDHPVREWDGAERVFAPVFRDRDYWPEAIALRNENYGSGAEGFAQAYLSVLEAGSSPSILSHLASTTPNPAPLLVHCSVVLSLCGVDDDVVAHEYSLTDLGLKPLHDVIISHLVQEAAFRDNRQGAVHMIQAKKEYMLGALKAIRRKFGSVEDCVVVLGLLSLDGVARLRRNLVVDVGSGQAEVDWKLHVGLLG